MEVCIDENEESTFVERIFLRVLMTDSDEQFQESLDRFLPLILTKAASPYESVRTKIIELLSHISKRVKAAKDVRLPVDKLVQLYKDPKASSFVLNFSIIYIKIGFARLSIEDKLKLIPQLVEASDGRPEAHKETLCLLVLSNLTGLTYPRDEKSREGLFGLKDHPEFRSLLLDITMDLLLYPYGTSGNPELDVSPYSSRRLLKDNLLDLSTESLEKLKLTVIHFLGVLNTVDVYPHLVVASADAHSIVADAAESQMKKLPDVDYDSTTPVKPLYSIYMCEGQGEKKIPGLNPRIRLKLLQNMSKFRIFLWPIAMKVLFESLYGPYTSPKLKYHALQFASSLIRNLPQNQLDAVWPVLLNAGLIKLIRESSETADKKTELLAYQLLATLVLRSPRLAKKDLTAVEFVFKSIENENDPDIRAAARDAAVSMAKAYKGLESSQEALLRSLLVEKLRTIGPGGTGGAAQVARGQELEGLKASRSASVRFLSEALRHDSEKVYMLLQASVCGDEDTVQEAKKALYSTVKPLNKLAEETSRLNLVPFKELLELVLKNEVIRPHDITFLNEALKYLRMCLAVDSKLPPSLLLSVGNIVHPDDASPFIRTYLKSLPENLLKSYADVIIRSVTAQHVIGLSAMLELVGCLSEVMSPHLIPRLQLFMGLTVYVKEDVRALASQITALLVPREQYTIILKEKVDILEKALVPSSTPVPSVNKDFEKLHGAVLLVGHLGARYGLQSASEIEVLGKLLSHSSLNSAAIGSLGLAASRPLPVEKGKLRELSTALVTTFLDIKTASKIKEKCCSSLQRFAVNAQFDDELRRELFTKLTDSPKQIRDVELCLASGELVSDVVLGETSPNSLDPWTKTEEEVTEIKLRAAQNPLVQKRSSDFLSVILQILSRDRHPHIRQTLSLWLLAFIKHCGHLPVAERELTSIQDAFIDLLSDSSGLVQETAGKGLSLVYEVTSNPQAKQDLLKAVVNQFTLGRKGAVKVSDDTKLFNEGELGNTPDGGKLSTYKELCQLANDVNQPELIYKFMHLANHNAVWNSKKGAAYTISSLMSKASTEIDEHLPKILIKLFRYQFDPMPQIQQSMSGLWSTLASPDTLDKYCNEIFDELLVNLTAVEWRTRISCCSAMADLIRGSSGPKILRDSPDRIGELWKQLFRVMDDIHEGTREAASNTAKTLSKISVKLKASFVLPVLLDFGMKSSVAEVRAVSVSTIAEMVKEGLTKDDAPLVVVSLLRSCADLDLANLYIPGASGAEALDKVRVPMIKSNHIVQALMQCVPFIDSNMMPELHSRFVELLKSSAGFGTRIVTSHFLILLSHHLTKEELQPYVGKFLGALLPGLTDRSPGIRKQYASTLGQLLRIAKDSSVIKILERLGALYFEKDDDTVKTTICLTLQSIAAHSHDSIRDKQDLVLPLAFFAKHVVLAPDKSNSKEVEDWSELWSDLAFGQSALSSNESVVVELLERALGSQSWKIKAQAARTAKNLATRIDMTIESRTRLVGLLLSALPGRTWDGKEDILSALASLASPCLVGTELESQMIDSLVKECKKEKSSYKQVALMALGQVIESLSLDRFELVNPLIKEVLTKDNDSAPGDKEDKENFKNRFAMMETAYSTLGKSWPKTLTTQERYIEEVVGESLQKLEVSTTQIQSAIISLLFNVMDKSKELLKTGDPAQVSRVVDNLILAMDFAFGLHRNTSLKKEALNLLQVLQKAFKGRNDKEYNKLVGLFDKHEETLSKESAPELKLRFVDIREMFKIESMATA